MSQLELSICGTTGQHQRGPDLSGGELVRNGHPGRLTTWIPTTQPNLHHGSHHLRPIMIELSIASLEHLHTLETRQPSQIKTSQHSRQLRTRRNIRQILRNHHLTGHTITLQPDPDILGLQVAMMPLSGTPGPNQLDTTFGPVVELVLAPPAPNTSPLDGFQHFGEVEIAHDGATLRVSLPDRASAGLWSTTLDAARRSELAVRLT